MQSDKHEPGHETTVTYRLSTRSGRRVAQLSDNDGKLLPKLIKLCLRSFFALDVEVLENARRKPAG